jgi:hypothetical protein
MVWAFSKADVAPHASRLNGADGASFDRCCHLQRVRGNHRRRGSARYTEEGASVQFEPLIVRKRQPERWANPQSKPRNRMQGSAYGDVRPDRHVCFCRPLLIWVGG